MNGKMKWSVGSIAFICIVLLVSPACTAGLGVLNLKKQTVQSGETGQSSQSRYWALLFAVGVYENAPDQDRPSMLEACDDFYDVLLQSPNFWQTSNIHVVKGSQALLQNLIKELLWLRKNSRNEDYVLVYLTTHGGQLKRNDLPWDLPPKDEPDGTDELLVMYNGYSKFYGIIWDDLLNFFLSIIRCQGLCLIVDSCYSGGFNDRPVPLTIGGQKGYTATAESFATGFVESLSAANRVVLMSCSENQLSFGSDFSDYLIAGFGGVADTNTWGASGNNDGIVSAEESFRLADFWLDLFGQQNPTISDGFPDDFPVTYT